MDNSKIAAISTPAGSGGIGIIKISGNDALSIAESVFRRSRSAPNPPIECSQDRYDRPRSSFKPNRLYLGHIVDHDDGRILDEVLLSYMQGPHSYTREDVIEINAHSGPAAIGAILETHCAGKPARHFTVGL